MAKKRDVSNAGGNIKKILISRGIKQKALASVWGVKPAAASRLISGKSVISADRLFAAADFLGCSAYELLEEDCSDGGSDG